MGRRTIVYGSTRNPWASVIVGAGESLLAIGVGVFMLVAEPDSLASVVYIQAGMLLAAGVVVGLFMGRRWRREAIGATTDLGSAVRLGIVPLVAATLVLVRSATGLERASGLIYVGAFTGGLVVGFILPMLKRDVT